MPKAEAIVKTSRNSNNDILEAIETALARAAAKQSALKPIEVVKVAISAYQAFNCPQGDSQTIESQDSAGFRRGTQASIDRLLFNVNYWLYAYEERIIAAASPESAGELLRSIAAWNSHTMKLNTLSAGETAALFERFCPPFSENKRRGGSSRAGRGKGPVFDFMRKAAEIVDRAPAGQTAALRHIMADIVDEARANEAYARTSALDAFYELLPAWCLQDRIPLVRATWWNDTDVMMLIANKVHGCFIDLGYPQPLCGYYLDSMRESIDNHARTVSSEESPYRNTPIPQLIELVRATRASHPDSEVEGYGVALPEWLSSLEQLIWNTVVCAIYGPMHTRPLLADDLSLLPVEGHPANADVITNLAQRAYQSYLHMRIKSGVEPEYATFELQPESLRNSGLERIENVPRLLDVLGYRIVPLASCYPGQRIDALKPSEVECLAILEHRRWLSERRAAGWQFAPEKDVAMKLSPYLVDWEDLPDRAREWNRSAARDIPPLLASAGLAISR